MPWWQWVVDLVGALVVVCALALLLLVLRRRALARPGAAFDLSVNRRPDASEKGWTLGVGRYTANELEWFRTFSVSWRPRYRFSRGEIMVDGRREPQGREAFAIHRGHVVVACRDRFGVRQMAMTPEALTGLQAWLEASPPGQSVNRVV